MWKNALPVTVMIGGSLTFSFFAELVWTREFRSRPTENGIANLTPLRFRWYFTDYDSRLIAGRTNKSNVKVAVRFRFDTDDPTCQSEPFFFQPGAL